MQGTVGPIFHRRHHPQLVAHKGNSWDEPENTLAAVASAIAAGADVVEIDISPTADGIPVAVHGPDLDDSTTGTGKVRNTPWSEIRRLRARDRTGAVTDHGVPRLADVLDAHGEQAFFNLDLKHDRVVAPVVALVAERALWDRCVISGSTIRRARRVLREADDLAVLIDLDRLDKLVARTPVAVPWLIRRYRRILRGERVLALNVPVRFLRAELVEQVTALGAEVWSYTIDDQSVVDRLVDMGVASITTNRPATIRLR